LREIFANLLFMATLFTIARRWRQLKYPLTDEWTKERCYIHATEYYAVLK
jgi:hypothetical protein